MTDDETFTAICAAFPFNRAQLEALHERAHALRLKCRPNGWQVFNGKGDGTVDDKGWKRLDILCMTLRDLIAAVKCIEEDGDPDQFIPF